jgi:hypothetical protein
MALTSTNDADTIKSCQNNALSELKLIIHHQHLDIELASPVYFCNRGTYNEYPVKRTDDGTIMNISLIPDQDKLDGMMVYKVQRNGNTRSDQSSINTIYAKVVEEASKMMQFFITWKIRRDTFKVNIILVEYGNDSVLSEDKLAQLYNKIVDMPIDHGFCVLISGICFYSADTVLMYDNTALNIVYEIARKEGFGLKITISEGDKDEYTMRPMWIDPERQVLLAIIIYSILIYIVSLTLQSTVDMIVDNRCTNIKLTSPIYFIKDAACPIQFPQQVNSESTMKVSFKTDIDQATFGGALLYHLQKREDESGDWSDTDEDESISIKLLVIWGCKSDCFYSRAYIILHESTFTWNEEKLKMLYNLYNSQYQLCTKTGEWWLHVDLMLKTKCKRRHAGLEIVVSISEEYLKYPREPLWFDSNRQVPIDLILFCIDSVLSVFFFKMYSMYLFIISVQISNWYPQYTLAIMQHGLCHLIRKWMSIRRRKLFLKEIQSKVNSQAF